MVPGFRRRSCFSRKIERDDDLKNSHPAAGARPRGPEPPTRLIMNTKTRAAPKDQCLGSSTLLSLPTLGSPAHHAEKLPGSHRKPAHRARESRRLDHKCRSVRGSRGYLYALPNQRACRIVADVPPYPAEPRRVFWKTGDTVFRLDPFDTDPAAV